MAKVTLGLDDTNLTAGLSRSAGNLNKFAATSQASMQKVGSAVTRAFAFAGGAAALRGFASEMGRVNDLAQRFGVSAESIQKVGNVAQLAGTDIEAVAKIMSKLTVEAAKGNAQFESLGISAAAFANAGLDQQVILLAGAYERANGDQTKMVELMDLLGNRGQEILPMISTGAADVADQFSKIPVVMGGSVKAMANLDDQIDFFTQSMKSAFGVAIQEARILAAAIDAISMKGFNLDQFNEAQDAILNPKNEKKPRTEFDPDKFTGGGAGGDTKAEAAALRAEKLARSASELQMDLDIAAAKEKGNDKKAAALEREKKIRADQRQIMNDVGLDPAAAREAAEKLNPEARDTGRKKIRGYSGAQRDARTKTIFDSGFNEFFHPEETKFGQRSKTGLASQSFNDFFHRRDPQRQTAEARAARSAEKQVGAKDPLEVMKAQLNALEKLAAY